ncbi:MAG: tyrosine-type recombinase/integrase [Defluviicoccus sp.]|nr:tyrosine-type recombinase/integrase [Defluviicoccus sp.]
MPLCELELRGPLPARAAAALRLLMLTGCRLREVLSLRWDDFDRGSGELRLRDSKTGARMVALTPAALCVLSGIRRHRRSPWVFAARDPKQHLTALTAYWHFVRQRAGVAARPDAATPQSCTPDALRSSAVQMTISSRSGRIFLTSPALTMVRLGLRPPFFACGCSGTTGSIRPSGRERKRSIT